MNVKKEWYEDLSRGELLITICELLQENAQLKEQMKNIILLNHQKKEVRHDSLLRKL